MSSAKPVYIPERVPFRGTQYVEAEAFDRALAAYERIEKEAEQLRRKNGELLREITDLRFPPKPARRPGFFSRLFRR